jgi:plasmid stabilization system protein ParE
MRLITRPRFYLDVAEEVEYLAGQSDQETALRWKSAVDRTAQQLLKHPKLGRLRPDLKPAGIRSWRVEHFRRWLIFYTVKMDALTLLRVRYGTMDLPALEMES